MDKRGNPTDTNREQLRFKKQFINPSKTITSNNLYATMTVKRI